MWRASAPFRQNSLLGTRFRLGLWARDARGTVWTLGEHPWTGKYHPQRRALGCIELSRPHFRGPRNPSARDAAVGLVTRWRDLSSSGHASAKIIESPVRRLLSKSAAQLEFLAGFLGDFRRRAAPSFALPKSARRRPVIVAVKNPTANAGEYRVRQTRTMRKATNCPIHGDQGIGLVCTHVAQLRVESS